MAPEEWTSEFEIIDPDEEQELALCLIAEYSLKVKYKNRLKKRLEQEYPNYKAGKVTSRYKDELFRLYPLLQKEKKKENKMSFSDLLEEGTRLLKMGKILGQNGLLWMKYRTVTGHSWNFWKH